MLYQLLSRDRLKNDFYYMSCWEASTYCNVINFSYKFLYATGNVWQGNTHDKHQLQPNEHSKVIQEQPYLMDMMRPQNYRYTRINSVGIELQENRVR